MRLYIVAIAFAAAGCTTKMSHPTRTAAQQQTDIKLCSVAAQRKYQLDVLAQIAAAFNCLEHKGYRRERTDVSISLHHALGVPPPPSRAAQMPKGPCQVPCRGGT